MDGLGAGGTALVAGGIGFSQIGQTTSAGGTTGRFSTKAMMCSWNCSVSRRTAASRPKVWRQRASKPASSRKSKVPIPAWSRCSSTRPGRNSQCRQVGLARGLGEQLPVGQHDDALAEAEAQGEVEFKAGDDGFAGGERGDDFAPPRFGKDRGGGWANARDRLTSSGMALGLLTPPVTGAVIGLSAGFAPFRRACNTFVRPDCQTIFDTGLDLAAGTGKKTACVTAPRNARLHETQRHPVSQYSIPSWPEPLDLPAGAGGVGGHRRTGRVPVQHHPRLRGTPVRMVADLGRTPLQLRRTGRVCQTLAGRNLAGAHPRTRHARTPEPGRHARRLWQGP